MDRPLVEQAFEYLTGEPRFAFSGKLDESTLTLGKPQRVGEFLVEVADHLAARFKVLPDTPPAPGWDKSARQRLANAADVLRREGLDLMTHESGRNMQDWWLTTSMQLTTPWVLMVSALLDEVEGKVREEPGGSAGEIGGANGES